MVRILTPGGDRHHWFVVGYRSILSHMYDMIHRRPDHKCLFDAVAEQHGYFTSRQAHNCGISRELIAHYTKRGMYIRIRRGLYRLSNYPTSSRENVIAAWLSIPDQKAVVSHESALELLGLSDVIPNQTHLTVPRTMRKTPTIPGVRIHTTTRPLLKTDITVRDGVKVTSAARSIVDAAEAGTAPEQIYMAISQAINDGITTRQRLEQAVSNRSARVKDLIKQVLEGSIA